jgi:hypothetical protein
MSESSSTLTSVAAAEFFILAGNRKRYSQLAQLFDQWLELRADQFAPDYSRFRISNLDYAIAPNCVCVDVINGGEDFVYRYWGGNYADISTMEMAGKSIGNLQPESLSNAATRSYREVLELKDARISIIELLDVYDLQANTITLRLPYSTNQQDVDVIFSSFVVNEHSKGDVAKAARHTLGVDPKFGSF